MLGRLSRWLRLLGFDCAHDAVIADEDLVRRGVEEGRVILTRDRAIPEEWRVSGICVVRAEKTFDQLAEVLRRFEIVGSVRLFSRCSECNRGLAVAAPSDLAGRVPARVLESRESFRECSRCGRVYWEGSHTERMKRVVDRLLATG